MANKNTLQLYAQLSVDVKNAAKAAQELEAYFGKLDLGDRVGKQISSGIEKATKAAEKYEQVLSKAGSGSLDKTTLGNITRYGEEATKAFADLERILSNVENASIQGIFQNFKKSNQDVQNFNKQISELSERSKAAAKTLQEELVKGLNQIEQAKTPDGENLFNTKSFKGFENDLKGLISTLKNTSDVEIIREDQAKTAEKIKLRIRELEEAKVKLEKDKGQIKIIDVSKVTKDLEKVKNDLKQIEALQEQLKTQKEILNPKKISGQSLESQIKGLKEIQILYKNLAGQYGLDFKDDFKQISTNLGVANNARNKEDTRTVAAQTAAQQLLTIQTKITEQLRLQASAKKEVKNSLQKELNEAPKNQAKTAELQQEIELQKQRITLLQQLQTIINSLNTDQLEQLGMESKEAAEALEILLKEQLEKATGSFKGATQGAAEASNKISGIKGAANEATTGLSAMQQEVSQLINRFTYFTSIAGIMQIVTKAIRSAYQSVKELDEAMNNIAVVTEMTTDDLWGQIDAYTQMANATGSTIKGVYEVAQLYYQQGLSTNEVMTMTTETLKMARIAGIEYAAATDYMTATIKGFGLAYEEVAHISDVYSNLAAKTATDTEEIAIAMSKVASIAHSTGMEMETTAAMLAQILEVTREAPETAGTALKTVIARFGEVKTLIEKGETTGTDEEGEVVDVNKIDAALKTAGLSLLDQTGQIRDLDDVLIELSSRWSSLSDMQQRYIATQAAGSRQQSRFLALMNDYEGLMKMVGYANDSAGASQEQFNKTLESLASKLNNLHNAWTEFTTGIANSTAIKGAVDLLTNLLNVVNDLTGSFGDFGTAISRVALIGGGLKISGNVLGGILSQNKALAGMSGVQALGGFGDIGSILRKVFYKDTGIHKATKDGSTGDMIQINSLVDGYYKAKEALDNFDDSVNLNTTNLNILEMGFKKAGTSIKAFWGALSVGAKVSIAIAAISAIIAVLDHFIISSKEAAQGYDDFIEKTSTKTNEIKKTSEQLSELNRQLKETTEFDSNGKKITLGGIEELSQGVNYLGENLSLSAEEMAKFTSIAQSLVDLGLYESYDDAAEALGNYNTTIRENIDLLTQELKLEAAKKYEDVTTKEYNQNKKYIKDQRDKISEATINSRKLSNTGVEEVDWLIDTAIQQLGISGTDYGDQGFEINAQDLFKNYDALKAKVEELYSINFSEENPATEQQKAAFEITLGELEKLYGKAEQTILAKAEGLKEAQQVYVDQMINWASANTNYLFMDSSIQSLIEEIFAINPDILTDENGEWNNFAAETAAEGIVNAFETVEIDNKPIQEKYAEILALDPNEFDWDKYKNIVTEFYTKLFEILENNELIPEGYNLIDFLGSQGYNFDTITTKITNTISGAETTPFAEIINGTVKLSEAGEELASKIQEQNTGFVNWFTTLNSADFTKIIEGATITAQVIEKLTEEYQKLGYDPYAANRAENIEYISETDGLTSNTITWANELGENATQLSEVSSSTLELATNTGKAVEAQEKLGQSLEENLEALQKAKQNGGYYRKELGRITEAAQEVYGELINEDFVEDNLDLFEDLLKGTEEEAEEAGKEISQKIFGAWSEGEGAKALTAGTQNFQGELAGIVSYADLINKALIAIPDNLVIGGAFDVSNILGNIALTEAETQALSEMLAGLGFSAVWEQTGVVDETLGLKNYKLKVINTGTNLGMANPRSGGGGGGGGGGKNDTLPQQDRFYNYIKNLEGYEHAMENLQDEMEILFDSDSMMENLDAQTEKFSELLGATQSYLNALESDAEKTRGIMTSKFGQYITFAEDGSIRLTEAYYNATGEIVEEMDQWIDEYDDVNGRIDDQKSKLLELKKEAIDFFDEMRDSAIDLVDELAEILKERDEKALEEKEKYYEELEKKDDEYLEAVRENIEAERKARDRANTFEDLSKKQSKLALLQRDTSGLYANEISSLQEEIDQTQQELADEQIDNILDAIEKENEAAAERHEEILQAMQDQIDTNVETRYYIGQAEEAIKAGDKAVMDILKSGQDWMESSDAERKKMEEEWTKTFSYAYEYFTSGYKDAADYLAKIMHDDLYTQTSRVVEAIGDIRFPSSTSNGSGPGPSPGGDHGWQYSFTAYNKHGQVTFSAKGFTSQAAASQAANNLMTEKKNKVDGKGDPMYWNFSSINVSQYKHGGLVDYTGPAWVDGTKSRPEAFLNPEQTEIIKQLAQNLVKVKAVTPSGLSTASNTTNNSNCEINIEIGSIGNNVNIDEAIAKIKNEIIQSTQYRNVSIATRRR